MGSGISEHLIPQSSKLSNLLDLTDTKELIDFPNFNSAFILLMNCLEIGQQISKLQFAVAMPPMPNIPGLFRGVIDFFRVFTGLCERREDPS